MRIGVHLQALRPGEIGGLEDYVRHLLGAMVELEPDLELVLFCAEYNASTFTGGSGFEIHVLTADDFAALDAGGLANHRLDHWFCPLLVLEPPSPGLPAVVTMPDLQHEAHPDFFSPQILAWRREHYRRTASTADRILTLSRYSKVQITELLDADPERVVVTPLDAAPGFEEPVASEALEAVRTRYDLPASYFYYPGASWPHKNHRVLFEALARLAGRSASPPSLVLTGARVEGAVDLPGACRRLGIEDQVRFLGYVPRQDLPALYALSLATVLPSLFEGFGIPVVEAMRAGSPVICSSATSLPEVAGDAAVYFDPERPEELCDRLEAFSAARGNGAAVAPDGRSREDLVRAGRRQAERFSWRRTAEATLEACHGAARHHRSKIESTPEMRGEPPLMTVVTPSLNQQPFIGRTIRSVLGQGHPRIEHLVIDGGSSDGTLEVLASAKDEHGRAFDYVSESDRGQAHAVNKGLERARGDIVGWLNSDDLYEPGCFEAVARAFHEHPEWDVLYGRAHYLDEDGELLGVYPTRTEFQWHTLAHECFICQPTVFLRRNVLDRGVRLDESLQMCMDYDLWIRLGKEYRVGFLDQVLASSRMYQDNKTISRRSEVYREIFLTVKKHYGRLPFSWALGRAHHVWDHGDPFFNIRRLTWVTYLIAGFFLLRHNWSNPRYWPNLAREVWVPLAAKMKQWRAVYTRDSAT